MKILRKHLQDKYVSEPSSEDESDGEDNFDPHQGNHALMLADARAQHHPFQHHAHIYPLPPPPPHAHMHHHGFGPLTGAYGAHIHHTALHPLPPSPPPPLPPAMFVPPPMNPALAPALADDDGDEDLEEGDTSAAGE